MDKMVCVITGGSRGLGSDLSKKILDKGYDIIVISRSEPNFECQFFKCDLSKLSEVNEVISKIKERYNRIDLLINNAAAFLERGLQETTIEEWDYIINLNLTSPFLLTQGLLPLLIDNKKSKIINISSTAGLEGKINQSAYCASKHGMMGLFRSLKFELTPFNVKVHNICTGGLDTDFTKGSEIYEDLKSQNLLSVNDISNFIVFLIDQPDNVDISEFTINRFKKK
jgi:NAD(P)-dependent dehydrogenase (short-subunit alcohol dehydrogenase family)